MKLWTAQYRYSGPDRLDVTAKGQDPLGRIFAPTWDMVNGVKSGKMSEKEYTDKYKEMMANSIIASSESWLKLLREDELTVVCFCPVNTFCHRYILSDILCSLGAEYMGERKV